MVKNGQTGSPKVRRVAWQPRRSFDQVEMRRLSEMVRLVPEGVPERMEFHVFVLYLTGTRGHEVDFERHACPSGTLVHVRPGQVHRFALEPGVEGFALLVSPTFLLPKRVRANDAWHEGFFDDVGWPPALRIDHDDRDAVRGAMERLEEVIASHDASTLTFSLLRHLLAATLIDIARRARLRRDGPEPRSADADRLRAFRAAIERSFRVTRNVDEYARALQCSARTLDRAARAGLGISAKAAIDARVVLEAKRMLVHEATSVAAIGEALGFSEATNFVKFFRARTGESPGGFRARYQPAGNRGVAR